MQTSIHVKVVGLVLILRGHVPTRMLSRMEPEPYRPGMWQERWDWRTDSGRHERWCLGLFDTSGYS